ncbi:MAG: glycosyltransferase [halophilic archaeon J07HB67]|jgi:Glycosyltransferase|nr:MAG: glycosyltransferase [halophilic archaeon J07HB67]
MHVGFVTSRYPPRTGGVETHVSAVATRLADRGHTVTVVSADAGSDVTDGTVREGVRVRRLRSVGPDDAFHFAPQVVPLVRRLDADVVHAHNYHALPMGMAAAASVPLVCTPHYHGESADPIRDRLLRLYRPVGGWALRRAERVVAVSGWERDRLATDFGVDATVIPNGIRVERLRAATGRATDTPTLLTVGRLVEYKGVDQVVRTLPELPDYRLRVAGDGPDRDRLERVANEEGVADRVTFLGYVPDDTLPTEYASADVFVTMSTVEAAGITVGEALAAGTPAVVRPAKGLRDWTDRDDCVAAEPSELAAAVRRVCGRQPDPETLPTWEEVTDRLEREYRAVGGPDGTGNDPDRHPGD